MLELGNPKIPFQALTYVSECCTEVAVLLTSCPEALVHEIILPAAKKMSLHAVFYTWRVAVFGAYVSWVSSPVPYFMSSRRKQCSLAVKVSDTSDTSVWRCHT